jgi:tetratricopeptide (TPR) repeat protein
MEETLEVDLSVFADMPEEDLEEILTRVHEGAETPAELLGFDETAINAIENIALGFYRSRLWARAALIFGFALRLDPNRVSCWRGLGACAQVQKEYVVAKRCYESALERQPNDLISRVLLGECLCLGGQIDDGLKLLKGAIQIGSDDPAVAPYVTRARAIASAGGGIPPPLVLKQSGQALITEAAGLVEAQGVELDPSRELIAEDIRNNPKLADGLDDLAKAMTEGRISLAEVGGFTENELDGAYAVACKYTEMGQIAESMQIAGYLIFIDPYKSRYYQLAAICMQRLKLFDAADHFYGLALAISPEDARSLVYRGEARIMMGRMDEGLDFVRRGGDLAAGDPDLHEVRDRANLLARQFAK